MSKQTATGPLPRICTPSSPASKGGAAGGLYHVPEVLHQDEPTANHPINAHKQMAGHEHPYTSLGPYKG